MSSLAVVAALAAALLAAAPDRASVRSFLVEWRDAWERREAEGFLAFYSPRLLAGEMGYEEFAAQKRLVLGRAGAIRIGMREVAIALEGERARVTFVQTYESDRARDEGTKALDLEWEEGGWRIVRESFTPSE